MDPAAERNGSGSSAWFRGLPFHTWITSTRAGQLSDTTAAAAADWWPSWLIANNSTAQRGIRPSVMIDLVWRTGDLPSEYRKLCSRRCVCYIVVCVLACVSVCACELIISVTVRGMSWLTICDGVLAEFTNNFVPTSSCMLCQLVYYWHEPWSTLYDFLSLLVRQFSAELFLISGANICYDRMHAWQCG